MTNIGIIELMQKSKLFEGFSETECMELCAALRPVLREYAKNQIIVEEGEQMQYVGIVRSGRVSYMKFYYTGNSHIVSMLEPFELMGMEAAVTPSRFSPVTILAQSPSTVLLFDYDDLVTDRVLHRGQRLQIMENLLHVLGNEGIQQMYKIEVLSKRALRDRIMTYLWLMSHKRNSDTFSIRMTQEQLAQYLCVNRSALSSELNTMEREGVITFQRDRFTILRNNAAWENIE